MLLRRPLWSGVARSDGLPCPVVPDITQLILDDHAWFRQQFADLDDLQARDRWTGRVQRVWEPLAADGRARDCLGAIFYPQLLRFGEDPQEETLDAIGDPTTSATPCTTPPGTRGPAWWQRLVRRQAKTSTWVRRNARACRTSAHAPRGFARPASSSPSS